MKRTKILTAALLAAVIAVASTSTPVLAWEPKGVIKKYAQNLTTNSTRADANIASEALPVKPGDILKYIIEIRNDGETDNGSENDMHHTLLTDTLPPGVELVGNPSQRHISEDIGMIPAGQTVTKEYLVRVTSDKNNDLIDNTACFTGDSEPGDSPQEGCDTAKITVTTPPTPPKPEPPTTQHPTTEISPATASKQPPSLPKTGAPNAIAPILGASFIGYVSHLFLSKRYASKSS